MLFLHKYSAFFPAKLNLTAEYYICYMTVRREQYFNNGVYFITFTCYKWLPFFKITDGYNLVYKWFDVLIEKGNHIIGYVIMPNHIHAIIAFRQSEQNINTQIGTGKRFMAYDLVTLLEQQGNQQVLQLLEEGVNNTDKKRGKRHHVFMASFDCKECRSDEFLLQKLDYIHNNPCKGKWNLADVPGNYLHSSSNFYATGEPGIYKNVTHFRALGGIDLTKPC
jgi:REP element-mobilizing transposase RayT